MKATFPLVVLAMCATTCYAGTCVCVATWGGGTLNIRSCPSTACAIVGIEPAGSCFNHVADAGAGWHEIEYDSGTAFASGDYLSGPQECADGGADCYGTLCSSNPSNEFRTCDSYGCGNYGASRGSRAHGGVDVKCDQGSTIYAPISGFLTRAYPYGDGTCCDTGFHIRGNSTWLGHVVMVFYAEPYSDVLTSWVTQGQPVATHAGLLCGNCYGVGMTDHSHIQDDYLGLEVDPSSWLTCSSSLQHQKDDKTIHGTFG